MSKFGDLIRGVSAPAPKVEAAPEPVATPKLSVEEVAPAPELSLESEKVEEVVSPTSKTSKKKKGF